MRQLVVCCGLLALSILGCYSKVDQIRQGAEDVDQHSQKIQEEAKPNK